MACRSRHNAHKGTSLLASLSWGLSTALTKIVLAQRAVRVRRIARRGPLAQVVPALLLLLDTDAENGYT